MEGRQERAGNDGNTGSLAEQLWKQQARLEESGAAHSRGHESDDLSRYDDDDDDDDARYRAERAPPLGSRRPGAEEDPFSSARGRLLRRFGE